MKFVRGAILRKPEEPDCGFLMQLRTLLFGEIPRVGLGPTLVWFGDYLTVKVAVVVCESTPPAVVPRNVRVKVPLLFLVVD